MSVSTNGLLQGKVLPEQILNFIKHKYDKNAKMEYNKHKMDYGDYMKEIYDSKDNLYYIYGFINFKYQEEDRSLSFSYDNYNAYENLNYYFEYGLEDMVKSETTHLSLGCWGHSIEIIKDIVTEFGGWIDENDCDEEVYYPILKNSDGSIKPIIYATMEDIYDKFGGIVIIKK